MKKKSSKTRRLTLILVLVAVVLLLLVVLLLRHHRAASERVRLSRVYDTAVTDIRDVLRVTVLESEEVMPVEYKVDHTSAFGIGSYRVRIYFDVEQMEAVQLGDTLFVRLPQPEVSILEDETRGFTLLDVWSNHVGTNFIGPRLTTEQENAMRRIAVDQVRRKVTSAENLSRARREAAATVADMLAIVPGTVIVYTSPFDALPERPDRVLLPVKD